MLIKETGKVTGLTKKAIEYYIEQGLISPHTLDNGYRDFGSKDIDCLKKIATLRKLGLNTAEIRSVLADEDEEMLKRLIVQKELAVQRGQEKNKILDKLSCGKDIGEDLKSLEQNATITEKLLTAFPGYYGRFICLHFSQFLNEPIVTQDQLSAYNEIIKFLDDVPALDFPDDIQSYLAGATKEISLNSMNEVMKKTRMSIENPEEFLSENKELLEQNLAFLQSDEFKNSIMYRMQTILTTFNKTNGYYDVFIPAMKRLSSSYTEYYRQIEIANEKLYAEYPDAAKFDQ